MPSFPPLSGLLVVAIEQAVAAPFCTCKLADTGARVIKVERAEGDFARNYDRFAGGQSSYFVWLNRGKESIALDLKATEDLKLLKSMIARADVLVQNMAPGALDRLGLGAETLGPLNPRLIQCNISGFGNDGPYRDKKAYDLLVQAESGLASVTGSSAEPARVGVSVCDIGTGMYAHAAILEALIRRRATGTGEIIDIAMFDAMADWMAVPLLQAEGSGENPPRLGLKHPSIAPYGLFGCKDGNEVVIAIQNEREWRAFCRLVLEDEKLADDPRFRDPSARVANRGELDGHIGTIFRRMDHEAVAGRLEAARIAYATVNTPLDLCRHPHLRRIEVATPGGRISFPAPPAVTRGESRSFAAVPELDAHGVAIREEFGGKA
ncbi:CaiB/BaiF CoA transferase family protein [Chelativorans salis]|uniref:CoA transferase n=1 Tax=Chelativorans salis TaxID=2978478 RepID=A0ABT2LQB7_9HYPH|nr:CaiB/BaiF CoA-transferase family protein [Chelativorans sp. EGI FJ00035]MCT7376747.1 CoA transferase [Chelativorans sp. EGI FJ00035]